MIRLQSWMQLKSLEPRLYPVLNIFCCFLSQFLRSRLVLSCGAWNNREA